MQTAIFDSCRRWMDEKGVKTVRGVNWLDELAISPMRDAFGLTYSGYPTAKQDWCSDDVRDKYEVAND